MFDLDQFLADLKASLGERSRQAIKEVVARAVSEPGALLKVIGEPDKAGIKLLYRGDDMTVLNLAWNPRQMTLPHDHRLWAVIGMYGGREDNMFWRRIPESAGHQVELAGGHALGVGDVTALGRDVIHSVVNPLNKISGALHVYGGDFFAVERSQWDAETLVEQPFDHAMARKGFEDGRAA